MNKFSFTKMAGTGNDFIVIDNRSEVFKGDEQEFFEKICRRRFSVGADGVILIQNGKIAPVEMYYLNSDGRQAAMCGNGARCAAKYVFEKNIISERQFDIEAAGRVYSVSVGQEDVTVRFGSVSDYDPDLNLEVETEWQRGGFVISGVPHYVIFVPDVDKVDVEKYGRMYRRSPLFKNGTNINFVQRSGESSIKVRTYERGVEGETLSCGTGSVASAFIAYKRLSVRLPVTVETKGGILKVGSDDGWESILLTGPAEIVYEGIMDLTDAGDVYLRSLQ